MKRTFGAYKETATENSNGKCTLPVGKRLFTRSLFQNSDKVKVMDVGFDEAAFLKAALKHAPPKPPAATTRGSASNKLMSLLDNRASKKRKSVGDAIGCKAAPKKKTQVTASINFDCA